MTTVTPAEAEPGQFEHLNGSGENLFSPETLDVVSGVCNHEAKALLMLYLAQNTRFITARDMGTGFQDFIGDDTEWKPRKTQPFNYCGQSFEPIGQVIEGQAEDEGEWFKAYAITERGQEVGVPLAALLLRWSIDNPDISLQQIFGPTQSRGNIRAPQNRIEILAELLTAPQQGMSLAEVADIDPEVLDSDHYDKRLNNIRNAADALAQHGLVGVERITENNTRQFLIEDPTPPEKTRTLRGAFTSAVYGFVQKRFVEGKPTFSYEECLEHLEASLGSGDGAIDNADIRRQLSLLLASNFKSMPGVKRLDTFNNGAQTKVTLREENREPLEDLMGILMAIEDQDAETMEKGRGIAKEIADDSQAKGQLMSKAKRFSPSANKKPVKQTAKEIGSILKEAEEALDTDTIIQVYERRYQRTLSPSAVQAIMRGLVKKGDAEVSRVRSKSSIRTTRNHYTAVVEKEEPVSLGERLRR